MKNFENENMNSEKFGPRRHKRRFFLMAPLMLIAILAKAGVAMLLWNYLIPDLFHGPELLYQQALGLMILLKLMVGFGGRGFGGGPFGRGGHGRFGHFRGGRGREFWAQMSDEERQKLRAEFHKKWNQEKP